MPLVTTEGFRAAGPETFIAPSALADETARALDIQNDADVDTLVPFFAQLRVTRVPFDKFDDGRGFSIARRLRDLGYRGRIRTVGHLISDQFQFALECGFDEIEISEAQALRQPEDHWKADDGRRSYRDKLRGEVSAT